MSLLSNCLKKLELCKYVPKNVIDIGAHVGAWSNEFKKYVPSSSIFMIDAVHYKEIDELSIPYKIALLYSCETEINWFEIKNSGDSIYKENTKYYANIQPIKKKTTTLDILLKDDPTKYDFIKIDAQGAEIDILKGSIETLKNCNVLLLELPFGEYNEGAPSFSDYISFLNNIGFVIFDVLQSFHINQMNVSIDIVFIKKTSFIYQNMANIIKL